MDSSFLGRGWGFPPTFDNQGRSLRMVEAEQDISQSLHILLSTRVGERVMRPTFGWRRDALAFEPLSTSFATLMQREIELARRKLEAEAISAGIEAAQALIGQSITESDRRRLLDEYLAAITAPPEGRN